MPSLVRKIYPHNNSFDQIHLYKNRLNCFEWVYKNFDEDTQQ